MNICYSCDNNYFDLMYFSIKSILSKTQKNINFFILYSNLSKKNISKILFLENDSILINLIKIENFNQKLSVPNKRLNNYENYYRFLVPQVINVDKIIFLDVDTFIRTDLSELFEKNLDGKSIAAVTFDTDMRFNAGVMLLDLVALRKNKMFESTLSYLTSDNEISKRNWQGTNKIIGENYTKLEKNWNVDGRILNQTGSANIVHYLGKYKPNLCFVKGLYTDEYRKLIKASGLYLFSCKFSLLSLLHIATIKFRLFLRGH